LETPELREHYVRYWDRILTALPSALLEGVTDPDDHPLCQESSATEAHGREAAAAFQYHKHTAYCARVLDPKDKNSPCTCRFHFEKEVQETAALRRVLLNGFKLEFQPERPVGAELTMVHPRNLRICSLLNTNTALMVTNPQTAKTTSGTAAQTSSEEMYMASYATKGDQSVAGQAFVARQLNKNVADFDAVKDESAKRVIITAMKHLEAEKAAGAQQVMRELCQIDGGEHYTLPDLFEVPIKLGGWAGYTHSGSLKYDAEAVCSDLVARKTHCLYNDGYLNRLDSRKIALGVADNATDADAAAELALLRGMNFMCFASWSRSRQTHSRRPEGSQQCRTW
jgi:hypothetical protein